MERWDGPDEMPTAINGLLACECPHIVDASGMPFADCCVSLDDSAAAYEGMDGCRAYFYTGPDFGCVHHAPKEVAGD